MKRKAHYLSRQNGGTIPTSILCVAVEGGKNGRWYWHCEHWSRDNDSQADMGGMSGDCGHTFWSMVKWHLQEHRGAWMVFLGASEQLTKLGFWDQLEEDKWRVADHDEKAQGASGEGEKKPWQGFVVVSDPPTIIKCRPATGRGVLTIIDARNYGVEGWESLDFLDTGCHDERIAAAAKAECLRKFMAGWIGVVKEYRLGSLKLTAASQAMHAYRYRFLKSMVKVHDNMAALGHERNAVYAGRNECWRLGKIQGPVYHLDFSAFYPSVAAGQPIPARLAGFGQGCVPGPVELQRSGFLVISEVTLETDRPYYPVRFARNRHVKYDGQGIAINPHVRAQDGDLLFPIGRFSTVLCGPELQLAVDRNHVKRIHATAWYEPSELFTEWGQELISLQGKAKERFGKAGVECVKQVRNSLFGRFAQWAWDWVDCPGKGNKLPYETWWDKDPEGNQSVRYRSIAWHVQYERRTGESLDSCPAISAWVYSLARVRLLAAILAAGWDNVHYLDSDSLWTNHKGYAELQRKGWVGNNDPGKMKLEGTHEWVFFHGLKCYDIPGKSVHVGVPKKCQGDNWNGFTYSTPETLAAAMQEKRHPEPVEIRRKSIPSRVYRHGVVSLNGRVQPYTLWEE